MSVSRYDQRGSANMLKSELLCGSCSFCNIITVDHTYFLSFVVNAVHGVATSFAPLLISFTMIVKCRFGDHGNVWRSLSKQSKESQMVLDLARSFDIIINRMAVKDKNK